MIRNDALGPWLARIGLLLVAAFGLAASAPPSLNDVLRLVEAYVDAYGEKASIVLCAERYTQDMTGTSSFGSQRRTIVADFAIVKIDAPRQWLGFRDVLEVDGAALSRDGARLADVLVESHGDYADARRISDASARFNLGKVQRNFNVPTTALLFFTTANHDRFTFSRKAIDADGNWQIDFKETSLPALITTPTGVPVLTSGTIWVRPTDGTVVRTLLKTTLPRDPTIPDQRGGGSTEVTYRRVAALEMWLPAEMSEEYETTRGNAWNRVRGDATYSGYRQFTTTVRIK